MPTDVRKANVALDARQVLLIIRAQCERTVPTAHAVQQRKVERRADRCGHIDGECWRRCSSSSGSSCTRKDEELHCGKEAGGSCRGRYVTEEEFTNS